MNVKGEIKGNGILSYSNTKTPISFSGDAKTIEDKITNLTHLNITLQLLRDFSIINVVSLNGSTLNNSEGEYKGKSNTYRGTDWIKSNGELLENEGVRVDLTLKKIEKPFKTEQEQSLKQKLIANLLKYHILEE